MSHNKTHAGDHYTNIERHDRGGRQSGFTAPKVPERNFYEELHRHTRIVPSDRKPKSSK